METWWRLSCPHCGVRNWVCGGDMDDQTVPDVEACKCYHCENRFFLPGMNEELMYDLDAAEGNPDDEYKSNEEYLQRGAMCVWGRKNPDDPYRSC